MEFISVLDKLISTIDVWSCDSPEHFWVSCHQKTNIGKCLILRKSPGHCSMFNYEKTMWQCWTHLLARIHSGMELLNWKHPDIYLMDDNCTSCCAICQCILQGEFFSVVSWEGYSAFAFWSQTINLATYLIPDRRNSLFLKLVILGY